MANPTTNYGFVLPTPTDLVTDLPADFDVALQGVDTRLKALQPGTTSGDLAYSSATADTNVRLPIGTSGQVLAVSGGGVPAWTTTADVTPLTTKGDLFTFTTVDARIGVGANGTILTADSAETTGLKWAAPAGGGKVFQVLTGTSNTIVSSSSGSYADTGLSRSITPSAATSKVLVMVTMDYRKNDSSGATGANFQLLRDASVIATSMDLIYTGTAIYNGGTYALTFYDSPATTSATTYKLQFARNGGAGTVTVLYAGADSQGNITTMEIGA